MATSSKPGIAEEKIGDNEDEGVKDVIGSTWLAATYN